MLIDGNIGARPWLLGDKWTDEEKAVLQKRNAVRTPDTKIKLIGNPARPNNWGTITGFDAGSKNGDTITWDYDVDPKQTSKGNKMGTDRDYDENEINIREVFNGYEIWDQQGDDTEDEYVAKSLDEITDCIEAILKKRADKKAEIDKHREIQKSKRVTALQIELEELEKS